MVIFSFIFFLFLFILVGIFSVLKSRTSTRDYLLAGQNVAPWLVALSAVSSNCSGYMFVGMIGYTYRYGLCSFWILFGFFLGDLVASFFIHTPLREATSRYSCYSFSGLLSRWRGTDYIHLRKLCAFIILIFLGTYAAAQMNAGSKALHVLFNWDYSVGAILGAFIIFLYCFAGGLRASIWTDAVQSFVMILSMAILCFSTIHFIGGWESFLDQLHHVSESYMNLFPSNTVLGPILGAIAFVFGWLVTGFSVVGQPHIMVRFMAMNKASDMNRVRWYYYSWYAIFSLLTFGVGLAARVFLPPDFNFDPELALPKLAQETLPKFFVGFSLAGLFAATMSTADSQILSCSASLTHDFFPKRRLSYLATKLATLLVTLFTLLIALFGSHDVFQLVIVSWSALAACFVPLIVIYSLKQSVSEPTAIMMVLFGFFTILLWRFFHLDTILCDIIPALFMGFLPYFVFRLSTRKNS